MTAQERSVAYRKAWNRWQAAEKKLDEAVLTGAQTVTISTAGNSQSVTHFSIAAMREYCAKLKAEAEALADEQPSGVRIHKILPDFR